MRAHKSKGEAQEGRTEFFPTQEVDKTKFSLNNRNGYKFRYNCLIFQSKEPTFLLNRYKIKYNTFSLKNNSIHNSLILLKLFLSSWRSILLTRYLKCKMSRIMVTKSSCSLFLRGGILGEIANGG